MHRLLPFLRWLPELRQPSILRRDLVAGITVTAIVVPQALAYARLAGLPPVYGLYAAFLPAAIAALWGSSRQLVTGPMAPTALISLATVQLLAPGDTELFIACSLVLALLAGAMRLLIGLLRLGAVANLLSAPVILGFADAAAIIIAVSQLPECLGVSVPESRIFLASLWDLVVVVARHGVDLATVAMGLLAAAIIVGLRFRHEKILVAVVVTTVVSWLTGYSGEVVGHIDTGLPAFHVPRVPWSTLPPLLTGAAVLTFVGIINTLSIIKVIATRTRQQVDIDQELIGQGLANMAAGLFHGFAISGSYSRSAVNLDSGAATGFSAVISALVVMLTLLFFTPLLYHLPLVTLAVIIISAVLSLVSIAPIRQAWRVSRADGIIAAVTFALTVGLAPQLQWGVLAGVALSLALYLRRTMRPHVAYLARHPDGALVDAEAHGLALDQRIAIIRFDGRLFFGAASFFEDKVLDALARLPDLRYLVLDAGGINEIDATGLQTLQRVVRDLRNIDVDVHVTRAKDAVLQKLRTAGLVDELGIDHFHDWNQHALEYLWDQMEPAYRARCPLNVPTPHQRADVWSI